MGEAGDSPSVGWLSILAPSPLRPGLPFDRSRGSHVASLVAAASSRRPTILRLRAGDSVDGLRRIGGGGAVPYRGVLRISNRSRWDQGWALVPGGRGLAPGSGLSTFLMMFGAGVALLLFIDGAREVVCARALAEEPDVVRDALPRVGALLELLVSVPILLWVTVRIVASAPDGANGDRDQRASSFGTSCTFSSGSRPDSRTWRAPFDRTDLRSSNRDRRGLSSCFGPRVVAAGSR
jgi:hypothetical protein